jgi:hypothetical protein
MDGKGGLGLKNRERLLLIRFFWMNFLIMSLPVSVLIMLLRKILRITVLRKNPTGKGRICLEIKALEGLKRRIVDHTLNFSAPL